MTSPQTAGALPSRVDQLPADGRHRLPSGLRCGRSEWVGTWGGKGMDV